MDRLEAMVILLAATDTGSLSAASRKLRIPLATVSRRQGLVSKELTLEEGMQAAELAALNVLAQIPCVPGRLGTPASHCPQVAVIIGASQGIGAQLVNAYRERAYVVVSAARSI
ncbi:hypothetical protein [Cupriavidus lacunae]|uniref:helix-turn-helix domain-containing protein n=1 Tax=Cupriavidus lacunae TaxID=2666307 RepID=UPI003CC665C8